MLGDSCGPVSRELCMSVIVALCLACLLVWVVLVLIDVSVVEFRFELIVVVWIVAASFVWLGLTGLLGCLVIV